MRPFQHTSNCNLWGKCRLTNTVWSGSPVTVILTSDCVFLGTSPGNDVIGFTGHFSGISRNGDQLWRRNTGVWHYWRETAGSCWQKGEGSESRSRQMLLKEANIPISIPQTQQQHNESIVKVNNLSDNTSVEVAFSRDRVTFNEPKPKKENRKQTENR